LADLLTKNAFVVWDLRALTEDLAAMDVLTMVKEWKDLICICSKGR